MGTKTVDKRNAIGYLCKLLDNKKWRRKTIKGYQEQKNHFGYY